MVNEMVMMINMETKLEEMTVTRQSNRPERTDHHPDHDAAGQHGQQYPPLAAKEQPHDENHQTSSPQYRKSKDRFRYSRSCQLVIIGTPPRKISARIAITIENVAHLLDLPRLPVQYLRQVLFELRRRLVSK